ncbi:MAG TPA: endonuclease III [Bacteroidota bacterium]|nr:endonuclease III [Bacteroidota bacterium]
MTSPAKEKAAANSLKQRTKKVIDILLTTYPEAQTALGHSSPLELLIATILSAQCTDQRVNIVTKDLFLQYRSVQDYANANIKEVERIIHSTGFYHAKAKNIIGCCKALLKHYGGKVPDSLEELITLPGVGRKTGNVVLGSSFGKAEGIVVDTHVRRISQRLHFTKETNPEKIEQDLIGIVPQKYWIQFSHLLIFHGRAVCSARKPACPACPIRRYCPSADNILRQ